MRDEITHTHWVFDDNADDVRGWPVRDQRNAVLGTVGEVLIDPATAYVTGIRLADGTRIAADRVRLGDKELYVTNPAPLAAAAPVAPAATKPVAAVAAAPAADKPIAKVVPFVPRAAPAIAPDDVVLELVGEELDVGKRRYDAGGVHVETHVVAESIARDVKLKDEHVSVARTKVDRALTAKDADAFFHDSAFEVTAKAEVPVVKKQTHVVEEIVVKKAGLSRDETVRDTIRQMDAAVTELRADALKGGVR